MTEPTGLARTGVITGFRRAFDRQNPLVRIHALMQLFDIGEGGLRFLLPRPMEELGSTSPRSVWQRPPLRLLAGIRSGTSAAARFVAIPVMESVSRARLELPPMAISAASTAAVPLTGSFAIQTPIWTANGVARGFVRVGMGADAMESLTPGQEGAAASIMSMGLDAGKIVGSLMVGAIADSIGTATASHVVPIALFGVYLAFRLASRVQRAPKE